ncbi:MAG: DUF3810 domain-containing protein [Chitinophagaceae bacterium]|nr:DUF3810 domain-containing protein [Chitinophagaceae bacterium]
MKLRKSHVFTLVLVVIAAVIHIYSNDSTRVENQYSVVFYPGFSRFLRYLFGWLPFSVGDVLYGGLIVWIIWKFKSGVKALYKKQVIRRQIVDKTAKAIRMLLVVYILFNLFWGINYNRQGIAEQLQLNTDKYSLEDLKTINGLLVDKTNKARQYLLEREDTYPSKTALFSKVSEAYREAAQVYPFLQYQPVSVKPSLFSWLGNYLGFTGYYNPFTGEAQVNTLVPKFLQPFTTCHEVAHQLGYAKEMEANFVAYLAAKTSTDTLLHYSVYLDLFMYSNRNLFNMDSTAAVQSRHRLSSAVQSDLQEWKRFNERYRNPVEPIFKWGYGLYLERNQQPRGVFSYDEVTAFVIAWYKKYGDI